MEITQESISIPLQDTIKGINSHAWDVKSSLHTSTCELRGIFIWEGLMHNTHKQIEVLFQVCKAYDKYVYRHVCMHVCMYVCMYLCMYVCILYVCIFLICSLKEETMENIYNWNVAALAYCIEVL